jgi:hypothetical protein
MGTVLSGDGAFGICFFCLAACYPKGGMGDLSEQDASLLERLYAKIAAVRAEAGRWKGRYESEREARVRAEEERKKAQEHLISALAQTRALEEANDFLKRQLLLLKEGSDRNVSEAELEAHVVESVRRGPDESESESEREEEEQSSEAVQLESDIERSLEELQKKAALALDHFLNERHIGEGLSSPLRDGGEEEGDPSSLR